MGLKIKIKNTKNSAFDFPLQKNLKIFRF